MGIGKRINATQKFENYKIKFMFSKKATKNYKIFTVDLTLTKKTSN